MVTQNYKKPVNKQNYNDTNGILGSKSNFFIVKKQKKLNTLSSEVNYNNLIRKISFKSTQNTLYLKLNKLFNFCKSFSIYNLTSLSVLTFCFSINFLNYFRIDKNNVFLDIEAGSSRINKT